MLVNPLQPQNALFSIVITELGMTMLVKLGQLQNADSPMVRTVLGMMVLWQPEINLLELVSIMALQPFRES